MRGLRLLGGIGVVVVAAGAILALSNPEVPAVPPPLTLRHPTESVEPDPAGLVVAPVPVYEIPLSTELVPPRSDGAAAEGGADSPDVPSDEGAVSVSADSFDSPDSADSPDA